MKITIPIVSLFIGLSIPITSFAQDGAELFKTRCTACHSIGKGTVVGPDLKGATKKYDEKWISEWIRGSQKKVNAGDAKAVEIFNKFNKIPMPDQDLNDAELKALLSYISKETDNPSPAPVVAVTSPTKPVAENAANEKDSMDAGTVFLYIGLGMIAVFYLGIIWLLALVIKKLTKSLEDSYSQINKMKKQEKLGEMERV